MRGDQHRETHQAELDRAGRVRRGSFAPVLGRGRLRSVVGRRRRGRLVVRRRRGEARLEEMLDRVAAAERRRNAEEAGDDRADRQRHQRERHRPSAIRAARATARGRAAAAVVVARDRP